MGSRCPLTWGLFFGSAALMIQYHRSNKKLSASAKEEPSSLPASEVVFVLGAPGTGKGTQCSLLKTNLGGNWTHLSAGDLLRAARDTGTGELADLIRSKMQAGAIVPSSITVKLLEQAMTEAHRETSSLKFLIDGFPRSDENLRAWDDAMGGGVHTVRFVLNFECPEEVLVGRLLERAKESGRSDDTIEVIRRRFKTHVESCLPILESMRASGVVVHTIDSAKSVQQVYDSVAPLFGADGLQAHRPGVAAAPSAAGSSPRKYLIGGNWKCHGTWDESLERIEAMNGMPEDAIGTKHAEVVLCVPHLILPLGLSGLRRDIGIGAQNCGLNSGDGAYTGEIGSHQLKALGCEWVIIGHSERRTGFGGCRGESEGLCAQKAKAAIGNGLKVIFAIGETKDERESGATMEVCAKQLQPLADLLTPDEWANSIALAYEPVWAIGTGLTATPAMAQETHADIRGWVSARVSPEIASAVRIQYGGSMKPANAEDLLAQPDIDGGLIGGASLKAKDFFAIIDKIPTTAA